MEIATLIKEVQRSHHVKTEQEDIILEKGMSPHHH
jgi:hypothetical protein